MKAYCEHCGKEFYREEDQHWKKLCLNCFIQKKNNTDNSTKISPFKESILIRENERLKQELLSITCELFTLKTVMQQKNYYESFLKTNIKNLLLLCHPDKHGNINISTEITRQLLDIRKSI